MAYNSDIHLNRIDDEVTSRLGAIAGIDRGTITLLGTTTGTATVTAVNTGRSILHHLGQVAGASGDAVDKYMGHLALTNTTTITYTVKTASNAIVSYQLVEYGA
jgi:hypothetical protein